MNVIYSTFAGEADWAELLDEFVSTIPQRIESLQQAVACQDDVRVKTVVHQMRGACGSYGFHVITPLATAIEIQLSGGESLIALQGQIEELLNMLASLSADSPPHSDSFRE